MVTFLTAGLRRLAVSVFEPCEHGLTDMDTAVVDDIGLHHFPAVCLLDLGDRETEQVITYVSEVQRFVGIWGRILNHHQRHFLIFPFTIWTFEAAVVVVLVDGFELFDPEGIINNEVKEALHGVILGHDVTLDQFFAYLCSYLSRGFASQLNKRKDHECDVSLELRTGLLELYLAIFGIDAIECLDCRLSQLRDMLF